MTTQTRTDALGGAHTAGGTGALGSDVLAELRRTASIYAAPVLREPSGREILEAARERCALVLGDIPPLRESWEDAAIFVDPRDTRALHEVLACLIDAPTLREDLAERARQRAGELSVKSTAAYCRLYERLLTGMPA